MVIQDWPFHPSDSKYSSSVIAGNPSGRAMSKLKLWWTSVPREGLDPTHTSRTPRLPSHTVPSSFLLPISSSFSPEVLVILRSSLPHLVLWGFLPLYQAVFSHSRSRPCCHSLPEAHPSRCLCTWTLPLAFRFTLKPSQFSLTPQPHIRVAAHSGPEGPIPTFSPTAPLPLAITREQWKRTQNLHPKAWVLVPLLLACDLGQASAPH